jgi:hypothetical protein
MNGRPGLVVRFLIGAQGVCISRTRNTCDARDARVDKSHAGYHETSRHMGAMPGVRRMEFRKVPSAGRYFAATLQPTEVDGPRCRQQPFRE